MTDLTSDSITGAADDPPALAAEGTARAAESVAGTADPAAGQGADLFRPTARPSSPAALLRQLGLRPRRGLSQSFLTDAKVTQSIATAAALDSSDQVLEVGPGLGILTQAVARRAARVVAFELDRDLAAALPRLVPPNVEI